MSESLIKTAAKQKNITEELSHQEILVYSSFFVLFYNIPP